MSISQIKKFQPGSVCFKVKRGLPYLNQMSDTVLPAPIQKSCSNAKSAMSDIAFQILGQTANLIEMNLKSANPTLLTRPDSATLLTLASRHTDDHNRKRRRLDHSLLNAALQESVVQEGRYRNRYSALAASDPKHKQVCSHLAKDSEKVGHSGDAKR